MAYGLWLMAYGLWQNRELRRSDLFIALDCTKIIGALKGRTGNFVDNN